MLTFSRNNQEYGRKESVCPDEPQKRLTGLAKSLTPPSLPPRTSTPEIPQTLAETASKQTQHLVRNFP